MRKSTLISAAFRLLLLASLALAVASAGQTETAPSPSWSALQDGNAHFFDNATAVVTDAAGSVYVTGQADQDYLTIKYNAAGVAQWSARYDGPAHGVDSPAGIAVDAEGGVYVTGGSYGGSVVTGGTDYDIATVKYDAGGTQVWADRYNGTGNRDDAGRAIAVDPNGNVVVTGYGWEFGTAWDYVTLKYGPGGNFIWSVRYDAVLSSDHASSLAIDDQANIYVTGESAGSDTSYDFATVKYRPDGSTAWTARYDSPQHGADSANSVAVGADGSAWVTGVSASSTNTDVATVRYSPTGEQVWAARYNGPGNGPDSGVAVAADAAGNAYLAGTTWSSSTGFDYLTARYSPTGSLSWAATYDGGAGDDGPVALGLGNGVLYVTGRAATGAGGAMATLKYDLSGAARWTALFRSPADGPAGAAALTVAPDGALVIAGTAWSTAGGQDFATVRYPAPPPPAPNAPSAFTAQLNGTQVATTWQHDGANLTGFVLERKTGSGSFSQLAAPASGAHTYTDAATTAGAQYTYRLHATGAGGDSASVTSLPVTIPGGIPGKLKAPKKINFGTVKIGKPKSVQVKLLNSGKGVLTGSVAAPTGPFTTVSGGGAFTLASKKSVTVVLQFAPQTAGTVSGALQVTSDDPTQPMVSIPITAKAR